MTDQVCQVNIKPLTTNPFLISRADLANLPNGSNFTCRPLQ